MTRGDHSNYPKLNNQFIKGFTNSLSAKKSPRYQECLQYFNTIREALLNAHSISVSRVLLSGSLGKTTALHYVFDVDIVVFVNCGGYSSFVQRKREFVNEIGNVIHDAFYSASFSKMKVCDTSYQISINGLDFDILPALNLANVSTSDTSRLARLQHDATVDLIHSISNDKCYLVSFKLRTGMAELSDLFIKEQSDFVRNIVIFGKHWCRTKVDSKSTFYGRSSLIELIAVHAGLEVESSRAGPNYTAGILEFLEQCANFSTIEIEFDYPPNKRKFRSNFFRRNAPYIMDPVNPYHNRMHKINPNAIRALASIAQSCLNTIRSALTIQPENLSRLSLDSFFQFQKHMKGDYDTYEMFESSSSNISNRNARSSISSRQSFNRGIDSHSITIATTDNIRPRPGSIKSYPAPPAPPSSRTPSRQQSLNYPRPMTDSRITVTQPHVVEIYREASNDTSSRDVERSSCFRSFLKCICCCFCCDD